MPTRLSRGRWSLFASSLAFSIVGSIFAAPGVVKMANGQRYEGDVVEEGSNIVVRSHGIESRLARADVASIEYTSGDFQTQFADRRAKLEPRDSHGRVEMARLALDHKQYDWAMEMTDEALSIDPKDAAARALRATVRSQEQLDRNADAAAANAKVAQDAKSSEQPGETDRAASKPAAMEGKDHPALMSPDDVQEIRKQELRATDHARISIPNEVRRNFAAKMSMNFSQFNAKGQVDQALEILDKGDDDMRRQVKIASDPDALVEYKRLQPMILNGCATSGCHGGGAGGDFQLFNAENDAATYTNFYILATYTGRLSGAVGGGFFGGATEGRMLVRGRGDQSLLLQYGLPEGKGAQRHPQVKNLTSMFRDVDDPKAKRLLTWMNETLRPVDPDYHVAYISKNAKRKADEARAATTKPATTKPATKSATTKPDTAKPDTAKPVAPKPATRPSTRPM